MKIANQPIPAAVSVNPVTKKGHDWLLGNFLFGTEIGESQLKKPPCIMYSNDIREDIQTSKNF